MSEKLNDDLLARALTQILPWPQELCVEVVHALAGAAETVADAVAAERERCARIAESHRPWNYDRPDDWTDFASGEAGACDAIAAAIRADDAGREETR